MEAADLRAAYPVLEHRLPERGHVRPASQAELEQARSLLGAGHDRGPQQRLLRALRRGHATPCATRTPGCSRRRRDVALTTSTTEGIIRVLGGLDLRPDEVPRPRTSTRPLGPLITLRERRGITIRTAPLAELATAVSSETALIACSHVSWTTGALAPAELAALEVPVLLDGAQGIGAVPIDVAALDCAFYAGSGQKWSAARSTGMLWIAPRWSGRLEPQALAYANLADPNAGLQATPWPDACCHDATTIAVEQLEAALAAHDVLEAFGWGGRARACGDTRRRPRGRPAR